MELSFETEERLRDLFKALNRFMVFMYRLGLARWGMNNPYVGYIMVIGHKGRKTGLLRRTPVNFDRVGDCIYCTAGFGARSDWYRNIMVDPQVELWLPDSQLRGLAVDVSQEPGSAERLRGVLVASGFAAPLFGIQPNRLSLEQLEKLLETYRLIRFEQLEPAAVTQGPGELAWVWPLATFLLLGLLWGRHRRTDRR